MRPDIESIPHAGKTYYVGLFVGPMGQVLARSFVRRSNEAQARGDAAALMREWLASRIERKRA